MENEKKKVTMSDFKKFVADLSRAHDDELRRISDEYVDKFNLELQQWFFRHVIVDTES